MKRERRDSPVRLLPLPWRAACGSGCGCGRLRPGSSAGSRPGMPGSAPAAPRPRHSACAPFPQGLRDSSLSNRFERRYPPGQRPAGPGRCASGGSSDGAGCCPRPAAPGPESSWPENRPAPSGPPGSSFGSGSAGTPERLRSGPGPVPGAGSGWKCRKGWVRHGATGRPR